MYKYITSLNNPLVKEAARLRSRKGREHTGRFLIDGVREVSRASASGISLETVFMCEDVVAEFADRRSGKYETPFVSQVEGARVCHVTINVMEKLGYGDRNEGVVAIARTPVTTLDALDAKLPSSPLIAVVEGVEKPGNLGAVLRTADAAGIHAVIAADPVIDVYNPNVIRASLGAVFSIPVAVAAAADTHRWLEERKIPVLAARVDAATDYREADFTPPLAIALGSESGGLTTEWSGENTTGIRLPMRGTVDSLNLSATAAVLFYEATSRDHPHCRK